MCARMSAVLSVPEDRVRGIFEGRVRTILSKTDFNKKAIPFFLTSCGSDRASGYIRLGMGRWVNSSSLEVADRAGMGPDEYSCYCGRGNVMAFDIVEVVRLDDPVPLSRFRVGLIRHFRYSDVSLAEVLS